MWRNLASTVLSLMVLLLALVAGLIAWGRAQYAAPGPLAAPICLQVESGSDFEEVARALDAQGAISSPSIFRIAVEYSGRKGDLKAGSFLVPEGASMKEITDLVTLGGRSSCGSEIVYRIGVGGSEIQIRELDPATRRFVTRAEFAPDAAELPAEYTRLRDEAGTRFRIAIAEGATSWQIVNALARADFLTGSVTVPAEGMLAPDSYDVHKGDERGQVIGRMIAAQEKRLAEAWEARADDLPYGTPQEALIMASIIEKETGVASERREVASVFVNRLERGMRLQTDPTVIYGITRGKESLNRGLRQSELRAETPYNTYVIDGLPPTPIANPGLASIEAALNPAQTDYVFFVAKTLNPGDGHVFSSSLEDHNAAVARLRALEAERR
ncbi:MAG: branched-chain alpha-keto acid dehydrogenase subunit E2 [Rhodobacterales bacterium]|nr:MAG: branched-chain alpha-keto acid dehydrogenase subunit E2 [Rhodobacterales bacterium]